MKSKRLLELNKDIEVIQRLEECIVAISCEYTFRVLVSPDKCILQAYKFAPRGLRKLVCHAFYTVVSERIPKFVKRQEIV